MAFRILLPDTAFSLDPTDRGQKRDHDRPHLDFIRQLPSVISGAYGCEAAHIRAGNPTYRKKRTGMQQKPDDCWTLPLTPSEHKEQHSINEMDFWREHNIDPFRLALDLYAVTGNNDRAREIIQAAKRKLDGTVERR